LFHEFISCAVFKKNHYILIEIHMADKLDRTDLKILKILQENCKITNLDLSKKIGLSPAPTLERVKKNSKLLASSKATTHKSTHRASA
jgi:hypothetical protein